MEALGAASLTGYDKKVHCPISASPALTTAPLQEYEAKKLKVCDTISSLHNPKPALTLNFEHPSCMIL